jgi:hypothetical protein
MVTYLLALGWWNFFGSIVMIGFFNESFGKKMLNDWTKIFATEFKLDYWSKFWLGWAIGLNIFFGYINVLAAKWNFFPLMKVLVLTDIAAYSAFVLLGIWGLVSKRLGAGGYSIFIIFGGWIAWGIVALLGENCGGITFNQ